MLVSPICWLSNHFLIKQIWLKNSPLSPPESVPDCTILPTMDSAESDPVLSALKAQWTHLQWQEEQLEIVCHEISKAMRHNESACISSIKLEYWSTADFRSTLCFPYSSCVFGSCGWMTYFHCLSVNYIWSLMLPSFFQTMPILDFLFLIWLVEPDHWLLQSGATDPRYVFLCQIFFKTFTQIFQSTTPAEKQLKHCCLWSNANTQ